MNEIKFVGDRSKLPRKAAAYVARLERCISEASPAGVDGTVRSAPHGVEAEVRIEVEESGVLAGRVTVHCWVRPGRRDTYDNRAINASFFFRPGQKRAIGGNRKASERVFVKYAGYEGSFRDIPVVNLAGWTERLCRA